MKPIYRTSRVRALDHAVIEGLGVPGRQLMEIAGLGAAAAIHARWPGAPTAILCGPGNNGGDGYVVARWLHGWGHPVRIWASAPPTTEDACLNAALAERLGLAPLPLAEATAQATVLVDALLGTGQQRAPRGQILAGVEALAAAHQQGRAVVCLDLPTGYCSETGQPLLLCAPASLAAGEIETIDIGLDLAALVDPALGVPDARVFEAEDFGWSPPAQGAGAAKWDKGHVAIRARGGAAVLAAHGAFTAGVGLVTILLEREEWASLHGLRPEVILAPPEDLDPRRHDVLLIGPALGAQAAAEVRARWVDFPGTLVADADALTALAQEGFQPVPDRRRLITPHAAEAARLLGIDRAAVEADRFAAARALGDIATTTLKGPGTLVAEGGELWAIPVADARLGTAGSGDVLAGLTAGMCCRGRAPAASAAWLHAMAGGRMPDRGSASDLLLALAGAWPTEAPAEQPRLSQPRRA